MPAAELSIPAAQTFPERSELSYRKCRAGGPDGDAQPMLANSETPVGKQDSDIMNRNALA